jgi:hypothetical protein
MQLQRAERKKAYLKLNISAPSGAGKTYSALRMAHGLIGAWEKIAVIDTENSSASLYSHLGSYNVIDLAPPFSPERYIEAIETCLKAGIECIIIDSSSHEWGGPGGCLEINDKLAAARYKGNSWSAWNETTPRHDAFVNKVLQARCHIITCTRSKMDTVMGEDKKVKKVGMKDMQRDGWEYELTVSLSIDRDTHMASASKDRTELFEGADPFLITEETGKLIKKWCELGKEVLPETIPTSTQPTPPASTSKLAKPPVQQSQEELDAINTWLTAIAGYADLETLTRNFNANKAYVNNTPQVYEAFKKRKLELDKQPA